jgi:hypothetical protein
MLEDEIVPIPSLPDYGVTRDGRVFRLTAFVRMPHSFILPRPIKTVVNAKRGRYLQFARGWKVHRCVAEAFIPNPHKYRSVAHNDGNPANNRVENLRWDSDKNNHADKQRHGTIACGEKQGHHKLTAAEVREARARAAAGESHTSIAADMPVDRSVLSRAIRKATWAHV